MAQAREPNPRVILWPRPRGGPISCGSPYLEIHPWQQIQWTANETTNHACLGYVRDYTTQLYSDMNNKPWFRVFLRDEILPSYFGDDSRNDHLEISLFSTTRKSHGLQRSGSDPVENLRAWRAGSASPPVFVSAWQPKNPIPYHPCMVYSPTFGCFEW